MQIELIVVSIAILIFSVIIHELAHGYSALFLGDPTAKLANRLTLNPISHLDPVGSVILPFFLALTSPFIIGWAKPVPYNPYNLSNQRWGEAIVAMAGPLSNLIVAIIFGLLLRAGIIFGFATESFITITSFIVFINILLGIFNLLPFPGMDGLKVLKSILPYQYSHKVTAFEHSFARYGMISLFLFIFVFLIILWPVFIKVISFIFTLITGVYF